ncbi:hypothetical protein RPMA_12480 [Tardiphaga alba]|uniref:Uncharacterized protein n=1 Tax=Tardiphaga alba TaxID=340268 RepID=A0ABX8A8I8_9BRAD|nr:hypothetical protein [Tardiphaga alba]QUS39562.1 hypothetical protein RPMA_12480 [Tardiphaga alba]
MAPPITMRMAQALRERKPLALLAEIEHPDGTARFWSGIGPLQWNGYRWTGAGVLGSITPIKQTSALQIQELQFNLSGVDPDVASRLNDDVRNLGARAWLACLGKGNTVEKDPYQIVDAVLDYQSLSAAEDGTVTISITARTGFYTLERALDDAWTTEEQKLTYPTDSGLDMIPALQNQDIQWTPT